MKTMGRRERNVILILILATVSAVFYSSKCLFVDGVLSWHIRQQEYWAMILELAVLFAAFWLVLWRAHSNMARLAGIAAVMSAFLWMHVVLIPVVAAGFYLWYLCTLGRRIRRLVSAGTVEPREGTGKKEPMRDFLMGSMAVLVMFCLMSAIGIGGIPYLWGAVFISAGFLIADTFFRRREEKVKFRAQEGKWSPLLAAAAAFVLTMFAIQAGRMNIAVDYDSLWYGVRGAYILDNGHGIYENLGTMGVVYTYSKGFETLTLPLASLPSYSFLISFNLWMAAGVLYGAYRAAGHLMEKRLSLILVVCLSSIPGIMNMSITAKTDIPTLFLQILMIEEMLRWKEGERWAFYYSLAAFLMSWTMKPTALVFSTAIYVCGIAEYLVCRYFDKNGRAGFPSGDFSSRGREKRQEKAERSLSRGVLEPGVLEPAAVSFLGLAALTGIWARTVKITGVPVTSVFSSIFTKLGFSMKYPYSVQHLPNSRESMSAAEWIKMAGKRIYGVLFNPQGPDMDHVILAWGSLFVLLFLVIWVIGAFAEQKEESPKEKAQDRWLAVIVLPFAAGNVISLIFLTQADGNYFMLFYTLLAICGLRRISRMKKKKVRSAVVCTMVPVILFSAAVMTLTNWNWSLGFTPVDLIHRGYYDHRLVKRDEMAENGNGQIWSILEEQPECRVIAVGKHPDVLAFPCNVQSYDDITGSQGNVVLAKSMDNFVEFMRYADTDYVYIQAGYMEEGMRCFSLTRDLIEYGVLMPVCYDHGNVLAEVDTDGGWSEESAARLTEFDRKYPMKTKAD